MLSSLDSRYANQLSRISDYLGDESFVYYMSAWSLAYAECTNDDAYLPLYDDRLALYERVKKAEIETKHQMTALLKVLEQDYPNVIFHHGLTSEDIMHNARSLQVNYILMHIIEEIRTIDSHIQRYEKQVDFPILGHTHGQPATPVRVGPYLRAKMRDLFVSQASYRLGGSNGQLTIHHLLDEEFDPTALGQKWLKRMSEKLKSFDRSIDLFAGATISTPNQKVGLLQVGPHNDSTFLSGISMCLKLRALARTFWDHAYRGILKVETSKTQTGSSAMPHKVNPILFENAEGCFSIAYQSLQGALEANSDTRGLRDLSNSVVNRQMIDGWAFLYLGVRGLNRAMEGAGYSPDACMQELRDNPSCLTEPYRYYLMVKQGKDPYWELKSNPPKDFDETIGKMNGWNLGWDIEN